jgi:hypothetical protein
VSKFSLGWLRNLFVPIIIVAVLFVAFGAFYLYWVPNRQRHLDDRSFRYLNTLSDQIRLTINTYDKMLDNAVDADISATVLSKYLQHVAPQLKVPDLGEAIHAVGNDCGDPPKIAVETDEGTHLLYLAFQRVPKIGHDPTGYVVQTDLDKLINGLLGPSSLNPFDVVLVARADGHVIYQKSLTGVDVAQINNLEDASGQTQGKEPKAISAATLSPTSRLEEIRIAGARYRLYSQPLPIGFLSANPHGLDKSAQAIRQYCGSVAEKKKTPGGHDASAASGDKDSANAENDANDWVLCGLVRADRFRSESQLIPYFYILAMLAVILLSAACYPYIRLYFSLSGERLRARDVAITLVFTCFIAAVVTFILTDIYFWNRVFDAGADHDMARLAVAIRNNFQIEQDAAKHELEAFDHSLGTSLSHVKGELGTLKQENVTVIYGDSNSDDKCKPGDACVVDMLANPDFTGNDAALGEPIHRYPYPFFAFWTDSSGNQLIKWTTRRRATPFVSLDDAATPFFSEVNKALKRSVHDKSVPTHGIGSQYSPTTGQNVTTFWIVPPDPPHKEHISSADEAKIMAERFCAALVTQPISVYNAVLPGAFQFAVLAPDGTVVFHSDPTRNLRENFLAETDRDPNLSSRVRMRSEGPITADYLGRPHRMYVLPVNIGNQDGLWTIVVFRDLHMEEVMNLEILSLVSILSSLHTITLALVMLSLIWARKVNSSRPWFWPDSRKSGIYQRLVVVNLFSAVALLVLSYWFHGIALLLWIAVISVCLVVISLLSLRRPDPQPPSEAADSEGWCSSYYLAASTLVLALAVVPCFLFFRVAATFEHRVLTQHTLLQFATDLEKRDHAVRSLYQEVELGDFYSNILAPPETQRAAGLDRDLDFSHLPDSLKSPVYSYHEVLHVSVAGGADGSSPKPTLESSFLGAISYPYNELAADDRHLAEGKSDVGRWNFQVNSDAEHVIELAQSEPSRVISAVWRPFRLPVRDWIWWLGAAVCLLGLYWLLRFTLDRIFLLQLVPPPPARENHAETNPASLIADLPMSLLLIGHETSGPISALLHRPDVQVREATVLQEAPAPSDKSAADAGSSRPPANPIDAILRDGRPLVLRNFERISDEPAAAARAHAALSRLVSALGNSVILISSMDPVLVPSIEASDRWRYLLRSFVRIDLNTTPRQRVVEDDADYYSRISAESYFHWLFASLPKLEKLVMLQLAQEKVVNPNDSELLDSLLDQGMVERRHGLLAVKDHAFAHFLKHALPRHTVKHWEKEIAGRRPFSLQNSLMVFGVLVVGFLVYTQGDVFNTWVTYATGVTAALPKVLQLFDNLQGKSGATS